MAAVTGHLEGGAAVVVTGSEGLSGLGAVKFEPSDMEASHRTLTGTHFLRSAIAWYLTQVSFQHELQKDGQLLLHIVKSPSKDKQGFYIPRTAIPWYQLSTPIRSVKVWGFDNKKMACPVFDLPAGGTAVGGSCPGANEGQSVTPEAQRRGVLSSTGQPVNLQKTICQSCVPGDTLVMVRGEGLRRIDELLGRRFQVWSGIDWRETHVIEKGLKPTVTVRTRNGVELRATRDHRILTSEGWVEAGALEQGDLLPYALPSTPPFPSEAPTGLTHKALGPQYRTEKRGQLPEVWTRELGVLLGYMVGDGSFNTAREYPTAALVAAEHDRNDLEQLAKAVAEWTGSESEVVVRRSESGATSNAHAHLCWRSKSLTYLLTALGLEKRGPDTTTPRSIWSASVEGVAGYLSGLFSTDGSIGVSNGAVEVSFANTSRALVREVQQLLAAFGIRTNFTEYRSNAERGYQPLWKLGIKSIDSVRRFAQVINFYNDRKRVKLAEALEEQEHRTARETRMVVDEVVPSGRVEMVYDLVNVGEEHQFLANGLVIHNCYAESGPIAYVSSQIIQTLHMLWASAMVQHHYDDFVEVMATSLLQMPDKAFGYSRNVAPPPGNILPVRLHGGGDFFNFTYASAWLDIANKVVETERGRRLRFWAPTRTWAVKGWPEWWRKNLGRLKTPNFAVRASSYHFDDPAPGRLHPDNAMGSTSVFIRREMAEVEAARTDFVARADEKPLFDWMCPAYSLRGAGQSCATSPNPMGGTHCRACWVKPDLRVNYAAH